MTAPVAAHPISREVREHAIKALAVDMYAPAVLNWQRVSADARHLGLTLTLREIDQLCIVAADLAADRPVTPSVLAYLVNVGEAA